jgi:hypothetical protein
LLGHKEYEHNTRRTLVEAELREDPESPTVEYVKRREMRLLPRKGRERGQDLETEKPEELLSEEAEKVQEIILLSPAHGSSPVLRTPQDHPPEQLEKEQKQVGLETEGSDSPDRIWDNEDDLYTLQPLTEGEIARLLIPRINPNAKEYDLQGDSQAGSQKDSEEPRAEIRDPNPEDVKASEASSLKDPEEIQIEIEEPNIEDEDDFAGSGSVPQEGSRPRPTLRPSVPQQYIIDSLRFREELKESQQDTPEDFEGPPTDCGEPDAKDGQASTRSKKSSSSPILNQSSVPRPQYWPWKQHHSKAVHQHKVKKHDRKDRYYWRVMPGEPPYRGYIIPTLQTIEEKRESSHEPDTVKEKTSETEKEQEPMEGSEDPQDQSMEAFTGMDRKTKEYKEEKGKKEEIREKQEYETKGKEHKNRHIKETVDGIKQGVEEYKTKGEEHEHQHIQETVEGEEQPDVSGEALHLPEVTRDSGLILSGRPSDAVPEGDSEDGGMTSLQRTQKLHPSTDSGDLIRQSEADRVEDEHQRRRAAVLEQKRCHQEHWAQAEREWFAQRLEIQARAREIAAPQIAAEDTTDRDEALLATIRTMVEDREAVAKRLTKIIERGRTWRQLSEERKLAEEQNQQEKIGEECPGGELEEEEGQEEECGEEERTSLEGMGSAKVVSLGVVSAARRPFSRPLRSWEITWIPGEGFKNYKW